MIEANESKRINMIHVLFNGYSSDLTNCKLNNRNITSMKANCSCTLIKGKNKNIIIDTMTPWDKDRILKKLGEHLIQPDDIDYVVSTHGHSDHIGNNNLFLKAVHIVGNCISFEDTYYVHDLQNDPFIIDEDIKVVSTPGHTNTCVSVIVENTNIGENACVVVAGDLFEREDDILCNQIFIDAGSEDVSKQRLSRYRMSESADYIIPGHGPLFELTTVYKNKLREDLQLIDGKQETKNN